MLIVVAEPFSPQTNTDAAVAFTSDVHEPACVCMIDEFLLASVGYSSVLLAAELVIQNL